MVAIDLIVQHVHSQLEEVSHQDRGWRHHVSESANYATLIPASR